MSPHGDIRKTILTLLAGDHIRLTPGDLVREILKKQPGVTRRTVQQGIKNLVAQGRLIYTHHFSASHVELNFRQPVRISERVVLSPANCRVAGTPADAVIKILDGAVFGGGDHPTTRMALRGLDAVLAKDLRSMPRNKLRVLDVGTGSGVLALAALKLGAASAVGVDIDPLACDAARKNGALNRLSHRLEISDQLPQPIFKGTFDLVLANLRPPTLKQLFPQLSPLSSGGAVWILSGFRVEEQDDVEKVLPHVGEHRIWKAAAYDWAAWALKFPDSPLRTVTAA